MKWKNVICILITSAILLGACGTRDDVGEAVSLEPHSLEAGSTADVSGGSDGTAGVNGGSDSAAGVNGRSDSMAGVNGGSDSAAGVNGGSGSTAGVNGGSDSISSGTDGASAAGKESDSPESGTEMTVYLQVVNEIGDDTNTYSLIYLDADDIPELVINMGDEIYSIYTVKNNELFCMADSMGTVELTYFEKRGIIAVFSRWNGGGDEGGYGSSYYQVSGERTLTYDDQPLLSYSYNATYDEKGVYTGTGVTDYFYMGQEIHEAAYQEKLTSLGIAEGDNRLCMEGSCGKEEIIALLSREELYR